MGLIVSVHSYFYGVSSDSQVGVRHGVANIRYAETECYVTGMTIVGPGLLLVCDLASRSLKLVDTNANKIISYVELQSGPRDLTMTSPVLAAATIPEKKIIQFVSVKNSQLSLDHELYVFEECHGLDFDMDKKQFVVSFVSPPKVEIITDDGDILRRIELTFDLDPRPLYTRFCHLGSDVLVSDVNTGHVTMFSEENRLIFRFSSLDQFLIKPRCMVVLKDNRILVCGWYSHNVILLSDKGELIRVVVTKDDGLRFPCALAYSEDEGILYVSAKTIEAEPEVWANLKSYKLDI